MDSVFRVGLGKRGREDEEEINVEGFLEHRSKRVLAIRSPELRRPQLINLSNTRTTPRSPSVADITPLGSDSEEGFHVYETKSAFSPWSSSPAMSNFADTQNSLGYGNEVMADVATNLNDIDMSDSHTTSSVILDEGQSTSLLGRIPTPMNSHFSNQLPSQFRHSMTLSQEERAGQRRLPSPISEGETASIVVTSQEDVAMDMDSNEERSTPKKGHARSKHSLRNWTGFSPDSGGVKKFSMGFKADCEKCRDRVPGHYSHIITYPNGYD